MNQVEEISLPKSLKHWINSIKNPACLLIDSLVDLQDGKCFSAIVENLFDDHKTTTEESGDQISTGRIQSIVNVVGNSVGWNNVPPELRCRECATQLSQGDPSVTIKFLQFLHKLSENRSKNVYYHEHNTKSVARANNKITPAAADQSNTIRFGSTDPAEAMDLDSLEDEGGAQKVNTVSHQLGQAGQQRSASPTLVFTRAATIDTATTHPVVAARKQSPSNINRSRSSTSAIPSKVEQLGASVGLEARAAARRRIVAHRRQAQASTSRSPSGRNTAEKKHLTAPAGMSVLADKGLALGSSIVDPTYRPGRRHQGFAETLPAPAPPQQEELSDSDYSTEATQLLYARLLRGRGQTGRRGDLQRRARVNANLPHCRSVSPAGRRHVHCRLAASGAGHRHTSPNEVHILHSNKAMEDAHSTEHSQQLPVKAHTKVTAKPAQQRPATTPSSGAAQQRPDTTPSSGALRKTRPRPIITAAAVDIDAVVSTERKNVILDWLQRRLGLSFDLSIPLGCTKRLAPAGCTAGGIHDYISDTHRKANKENISTQHGSENIRYSQAHADGKPKVFAAPTYLDRLTLEMPGCMDNSAVAEVAAKLQRGQEQDLQGLRYIPLHAAAAPFHPHSEGLRVPVTTVGWLSDPWVNGVLLAQVLAALLVEHRALIKQVSFPDRVGGHSSRLVLAGTEVSVHSRAQATHNLHLCMEALHSHIPGFPTLDYCADDLVAGRVSLWRLLDTLYDAVRRSGSSGRGRGRCRSVSPAGGHPALCAGKSEGRHQRSTSAPSRDRATSVRVSFADGQLPGRSTSPAVPRSQTAIPTPSAMPRRPSPAAAPSTSLFGGQRSRSVSPASAPEHVDTAAVSLLELRRAEKEHERERARLYIQRKRQQAAAKEGNDPDTSSRQAVGQAGWNPSTTLTKPRSTSTSKRASISAVTPASKQHSDPSAPAVPTPEHPGATEQDSRVQQNPRYWYPPKLSSVDVDAARNTPLPNISVHQQRAVREWLSTAFGIALLDAECGFHPFSQSTAPQFRADDSVELLRHPRTGLPYDAKFERSHEVLNLHAPPPLPLPEDRVRNGVLLGHLLLRLEPHAALHAHIPKLLHKHPRSLPTSLENIERVLWVFKLRRSPPLPLQYLCQPDEVLKGNVPLIWGLLWEIMQAYPYANMAPIHSDGVPATMRSTAYGTGALGGVLPASAVLVAPRQNAAGTFQPPLRAGLAKVFSQAAEVAATRRENTGGRKASLGLKGQEARHNVPNNVRYNYADPQLEHPVPAHTLPYSDKQRHQLDLSLLHWLGDTGVLAGIIGSLSQPLTLLALESYCRDGTLLCMVVENVLGLTLSKDWHRRPASYVECMSNLKHCFDVLRKCQHLRPRYLYAGVEEDICRGRWDCILGLLEDLHRFADNIHPHAQIFRTVDAQGRIVKPGKTGKAAAGFNYETVEAPYLGSSAAQWEDEDSDRLDPVELEPSRQPQQLQTAISAPIEHTEAPPPRSDLRHDVPYSYAPQLDLTPPPPPSTVPTPVLAPRLDAPTGHPVFSADAQEFNPHRGPGDLYPSNVVSGQNVANALGYTEEGPLPPRPRSSGIPTPQRPALRPLTRSVSQGSTESQWVQSLTTTGAASPLADADRAGRGAHSLSDQEAQESRRLAQALSLRSDSETETRGSPTRRTRSSGRENTHRTAPPQADRSALLSPRRSRSPSPTRLGLPPNLDSSRFHRYNRRGVNTTAAGSEVDTDSLEASPNSPDSIATEDLVENVTHNIELHKARKVLRWFKELGIRVEHKHDCFVRDTFSNGVVLCTLIQKLERCGPIVGTFAAPRTHSECVQNVRRCLELLAMRQKSIPLRTLSCEEEVLSGDMQRTIDLLMCIRKAYATYRR